MTQTIAVSTAYQCQFEATIRGQLGDSETETDTVTATAEDGDGNQTTASHSATVTIEEIQPGPDTQIIFSPLILKSVGNWVIIQLFRKDLYRDYFIIDNDLLNS